MQGKVVTSLVFQVKNVPAALYKAMGGFATNGVNMTKLESYQLGGSFNATQFYADIQGHPEQPVSAQAPMASDRRNAGVFHYCRSATAIMRRSTPRASAFRSRTCPERLRAALTQSRIR